MAAMKIKGVRRSIFFGGLLLPPRGLVGTLVCHPKLDMPPLLVSSHAGKRGRLLSTTMHRGLRCKCGHLEPVPESDTWNRVIHVLEYLNLSQHRLTSSIISL